MSKILLLNLISILSFGILTSKGETSLKPRIINTTDLGADPDDQQSMVRFLVQSNEFDVEGLIVTTSCWKKSQSNITMLSNLLNAYTKAVTNLQAHDPEFPTLEYLQSVSALGQRGYGMGSVGAGKDSPGSELIIKAVDKDDPRHVWICFWGGGNTLAQALWKIKNTRSEEDIQKFVNKIRVYDILGQDNAGTWIAKTFPNLLYIRATGVYGWQPGDSWLASNIQSHGSLGAVYPKRKYATEGDTPSFLHIFPNRLNNPEEVWQGGWGGRFDRNKKTGIRGMSCMSGEDTQYDPYYMYGNTSAGASDISRWSTAYNNDFQARMDWSVINNYSEANHHPVAIVNNDSTRKVLEMSVPPGSTVNLSAEGSYDPDENSLSYKWFYYKDPGTYSGSVSIQNSTNTTPVISVPENANGKEIHIVLEIHDSGSPNLYAYRRVILNVIDTTRLRVMMSTDFPPIPVTNSDPDDMQSMIRFLLYANEFDIEGLIATSGTFAMVANKNNILGVIDRYEKVYNNLQTYDSEYPSADFLRSVTFEGRGNNNGVSITFGCGKQDVNKIIGEGLDSEASNAIIAAADKPDPRPLWIGVWGGPREVAQAIWDVKNTRSQKEFKTFLRKLRIFVIACQDASHEWLMNEFPDLFIIESKKTYQGMFGGNDPKSDLAWINKNIRFNHGPLCDIYPHEGMGCTGVCEGDSPSFLYLVSANRGINDPEDPTQPSWGGQYVRIQNTNHYVDGPGPSSISKWREEYQKEFKERANWCLNPKEEKGYIKPRIINTTDLGADPDDEQSMVRQLVCSNEFDIEGLIVATGCWKKSQSNTAMLDKLVNAYEQAYPNLKVHAEGFPSPEYLKSISVMGQTGYGMSDVGTGKDSPGSELIIASVDKDDPRPVWVMGWGGMNNIAQAIWKVRETRSKEELEKFLGKLRLFDILGQDDAGAWIAKNFPEVFYIRATHVYNWQPPKNGDYQKNDIQSHGPLGAVYPDTKWATEGDTPAFMHVYPNGLNDPEQIDQGGWGGRFSFTKQEGIRSMSEVHKIKEDGETRYDPYYMYGNTPDGGTSIRKWEKGYNNDFAARMDWSITDKYEKTNHHPVAVLNSDKSKMVMYMNAKTGSTIKLSAAGSSDPDGDVLSYLWSFYKEAGSFNGPVNILSETNEKTKIEIPKEASGKTIHIILEVFDNGTPNLYAYRRMIISVL